MTGRDLIDELENYDKDLEVVFKENNTMVVNVLEIDEEEAEIFFDMERQNEFPIFR